MHLEIDNLSYLLLELSQVYFIDKVKILGSLVVPKNDDLSPILQPSENEILARVQMITVRIVQTVHALLTRIKLVDSHTSILRTIIIRLYNEETLRSHYVLRCYCHV